MGRVLLIGEAMLDEYVYGDVHRISPESASPVLTVTRRTRMIGGAGNVAAGLAALECPCDFLTVCGGDEAGREVMTMLKPLSPGVTAFVTVEADRPTPHKVRCVSEQHSSHMLRIDSETVEPISSAASQGMMRHALACLDSCDVVVISDYCKGLVTAPFAQMLIGHARACGKIVLVDSKRSDLTPFARANVIKLNADELKVSGHTIDCGIEHIVVTSGELGITLWSGAGGFDPFHVPGKRVRVADVSGAGDTVTAVLAMSLANGSDIKEAVKLANDAAAIAVAKPGTATVTLAELRNGGGKIVGCLDWTLVDQRIREWRGDRIGFANGCFDMLHTGHLHLLKIARENCDHLIVGLNGDTSVRHLKGEDRPIHTWRDRATMLAALDTVDLIVGFTGDEPTELVERIRPHTMFKGSDYTPADVAGRQYANAVQIIPHLEDGRSTSETIEHIRKAESVADLAKDTAEYVRHGFGESWCDICHGECRRRPRHGEFNI